MNAPNNPLPPLDNGHTYAATIRVHRTEQIRDLMQIAHSNGISLVICLDPVEDAGDMSTADGLGGESLFSFAAIQQAAREQNGWHLRGVYQLTEAREGCNMATGIVVFERRDSNDSGTAAVNVHPDGSVEFYWGHYDLSMVQSREGFADRIAKGR